MELETSLKRTLDSAAGPLPGEPDLAAIARRVRRRRRLQRVAVAAVATPVVLVVAVLVARTPQVIIEPVPGDAPAATVDVPEAGEASAVWHRGAPVLVVNADGGVYAVEAISPHRDLEIGDAVAWCRPAQIFVAAHGGDLFAPDGGYLGGASPTGLPTYDTDVDGEVVSIGQRRAPAPRPEVPATTGPADPDTTAPCLGRDADPDAVVQHDWPPGPGAVSSVEEAVARGDAARLVVSGRLLVEDGIHPRLCGLEGGVEECRGQWLPVAGVVGLLPEDLGLVIFEGLWRVDLADGTVTSVTHLRTELEAVEPRHGDPTSPPSPAFGPSGEIVVGDQVLQVPAVDLGFGRPPGEPLPAGAYELWLDNHGLLPHTLVSETLDLDIDTSRGQRGTATVHLPQGEHVLYCRVPGHREAGMEFRLVVD